MSSGRTKKMDELLLPAHGAFMWQGARRTRPDASRRARQETKKEKLSKLGGGIGGYSKKGPAVLENQVQVLLHLFSEYPPMSHAYSCRNASLTLHIIPPFAWIVRYAVPHPYRAGPSKLHSAACSERTAEHPVFALLSPQAKHCFFRCPRQGRNRPITHKSRARRKDSHRRDDAELPA